MGKTKVVLDTNTIVSAFGWGGNPRKILRMILDGEVSLFVSPPQLDELRKVLEYPRLGFDRRDREKVLEIIVGVSTLVQPKQRIDAVVDDPADNMVLACAASSFELFFTRFSYLDSGHWQSQVLYSAPPNTTS